ncbi:MAG: carboxymuconolactone decarboxylase family protein [Bacteriodetes bacterium]|nr:carboxymuconolactone decarboxylase family protein [Bacteroidota bacterium]
MRASRKIAALRDEMATALSSEVYLLCLAAAAAVKNKQQVLSETIATYVERKCSVDAMYEALLQTYLFAGFPAALEGLMTLTETLTKCSVEYTPPDEELYNVDEFRKRGELLCQQIYTTVYPTIRERLGAITPDLDDWMIVEGYGKTLSRPLLDAKTRELITISMLAVTGWERQLFSHIRGALNVGASLGECTDALLPTLFLTGDEMYDNAIDILSKFAPEEDNT